MSVKGGRVVGGLAGPAAPGGAGAVEAGGIGAPARRALRQRDIVMFGADDWGRHPSSSQHIARVLCRENRVLWVDSIGMRRPRLRGSDVLRAWRKLVGATRRGSPAAVPDGLSLVVPLALPFHGSPAAERLNRWLVSRQVVDAVRRARMADPLLWFTSPMSEYLLDRFPRAPVIYYVADDYGEHYPDYAGAIRAKEQRLLGRADLVLAASERLLQAAAERHPNARLLSHGVDFAHFACPAGTEPADLARVPRPRVGYVGWVRDLIDLELFSRLAAAHPEWSLVLIGQVAADVQTLLARPNVYALGRKEYGQLPGYVAGLDVGLVPYRYTGVTHNCNPLKLREYLAAGIPVVSYDYPAVRPYGDVIRIAASREEFIAEVAEALGEGGGAAAGRRARVAGETWERMVEGIAPWIEALQPTGAPAAGGRP